MFRKSKLQNTASCVCHILQHPSVGAHVGPGGAESTLAQKLTMAKGSYCHTWELEIKLSHLLEDEMGAAAGLFLPVQPVFNRFQEASASLV
eukprot:1158016-Prorocentrum_minimum.AAC.1